MIEENPKCPKCAMECPTSLHLTVCDGPATPPPAPSARAVKAVFQLVNGQNLTVRAKRGVEVTEDPRGLYFFKMESQTGETVYVNPDHVVSAVLEEDEA